MPGPASFAVRQERWFRRDPRVRWFEMPTTIPVAVALLVRSPRCMAVLTLTKHHGLGNDFLVPSPIRTEPADPGGRTWPGALCDRRRGIGADGLLVATTGEGRPVEPRTQR